MNPRWKGIVARNKLRLFNGLGFLSMIMAIFNFLTFAKVWSDTFEYYGIPSVLVYAVVPLGLVFGAWYFWFWYESNKLWEEEIIHQNKYVNPQLNELMTDVKDIKKHLGIGDTQK